MKALTLYQPWASLIAAGIKTTETRDWAPYQDLIGRRIAIHAGRQVIANPRYLDPAVWDAAATLFGQRWDLAIPKGAIVATAVVAHAYRIKQGQETNSRQGRKDPYGNYQPGRWVWVLEDIEQLEPPVPARGSLGLWEWHQHEEDQAQGQLALTLPPSNRA